MAKTFDPTPFDNAAEEAKKQLEQIIAEASPEERDGIEKITQWWRDWYLTAGHKRLGRVLKSG